MINRLLTALFLQTTLEATCPAATERGGRKEGLGSRARLGPLGRGGGRGRHPVLAAHATPQTLVSRRNCRAAGDSALNFHEISTSQEIQCLSIYLRC
ncbi:hypothetical protein E2C01_080074 [Portunus trituberculatus]|uniref:Secreted protein n=1 Tax=Portunus trituberculatus TaxID=210409 RepID=A0A5B7IS65_PORTR|nr:hypothetical protein [Portunus trituberculatus]